MLKNSKEHSIKRKRYLHENINYLLKINQLDAKSLSIETGIPTTTLSRLKKNDSNPTVDSLEPLADFFRIDVNDLLYEELASNKHSNKQKLGKIQIIPVIKIADINKSPLSQFALYSSCTNNVSEHAFGIHIESESFIPVFRPQSIAIIEPNIEPKDADYVICVLEKDNVPVFRQIFIDGSNFYFKPINPNLGTMTIAKNFKIFGTLTKVIDSYR